MGEEQKSMLQELSELYWQDLAIKEDLSETGEKRMRVEGILQQAEVINQNNRIYPKSVMVKAVQELEPLINTGKVFGMLDHPSFFSSGASLKEASHLLSKLWWDERDENILRGEMLVFNTPCGEMLKEILRAGGRPGISSRGMGELAPKKLKSGGEVNVVKPGFRFKSFDFVIDPSVKCAEVTRIMEEKLAEIQAHKGLKEGWYKEHLAGGETSISEEEKGMEKEKEKEQAGDTSAPEPQGDKVADLTAELDKVKKERDDLQAQLASKDETIEKQLNVIKTCVSFVESSTTNLDHLRSELVAGGFMKAPEEKKVEQKTEEELKLAESESKVEALRTELADAKQKLQEKEVEAHIAKVLEGKPFGLLLKKRLTGCRTVEEVDAKLRADEEFAKTLLGEGDLLAAGKGKVEVKGESDVKKEAKKLAGIKEKK